jgi:Zinc finger, C3HC4 type (RING finger)
MAGGSGPADPPFENLLPHVLCLTCGQLDIASPQITLAPPGWQRARERTVTTMSSPSDSDISLPPSAFHSPVSDGSPQYRHPNSQPTAEFTTAHLPRLSSPRIFRDIFSTAHNATRTLPPARFQETSQDVTGAIADASRAIQNAQQALQLPPIVDLTESSPSQSPQSRFLSRTTHPHDARQTQRRSTTTHNTLHDPVYGHHPQSRPTAARPAAMPHPPNQPAFLSPYIQAALLREPELPTFRIAHVHDYQPPRPPTQDEIRREESRAIQRQRNARALWEHNQRDRARHLQRQTPEHEPTKDLHSPSSPFHSSPEIESVDLTALDENSTLADALSKQRRDAVSSQNSSFDTPTGRSALTSYKCPICMETPKDATTTICGHLFCHRCIIDTLKWSEEQRSIEMGGGKADGMCPVCRKPLKRKDRSGTGRTLIPLEIKLVRRKRKRDGGKGKERARDDSEVVDLEKLEKVKKIERERSAEMWNDLTVF